MCTHRNEFQVHPIDLLHLTLQYHNQPPKYEAALDYLNIIFTSVFGIEFMLKLFAFRVKVSCYFINILH